MLPDQIDELVAWLRAQIDEDERLAESVKPLGQVVDMGGRRLNDAFAHSRIRHRAEDGAQYLEGDPAAQVHFARQDPARVLDRVAAYRFLLEWAIAGIDRGGLSPLMGYNILAGLALAYASREGHREEWRPA